MDTRKITITETSHYMDLAGLFHDAGLENTDRVPDGFITAFRADTPDGKLAGGVSLVRRNGFYILNDIAVMEELRKSGIGMRMLCTAMARLQDMGAGTVYLTAKAPGFFRKYGFRETAPEDTPDIFHCNDCNQLEECRPVFMKREVSAERLLFIDSCVSTHRSRTLQLCRAWLARYLETHPKTVLDMIVLDTDHLHSLDGQTARHRTDLVEAGDFDDPIFDLAYQFRRADRVLIGAPYWDCSFPSVLKTYIENVVVDKLTFHETEHGYEGLCPCRKITYITTAGGPIGDMNLGYDYIRGVFRMLGVSEYEEYRAEMLDIQGADIGAIMEKALAGIAQAEID